MPAGRSRAILAVVMVGGFVTALDTFIVNIAIPTIHADLHTGFAAIELVVAGYIFTYAVLLVTGGRIGDRITPRRAFMWGVAVFTVASLACGLAPNVETLIGARVVQGLGAALLYPQVFAIIQLSFSGGARARALGILSGSNGLASILGQVLGGLLLRADLFGSSWRLLFLINVPVGIAGWFGAARVLPRERSVEAESSLDAGGVVLLTLWLALLVGPLVAGRDEGWPAWLLLCLAAAVPAFALFALHEQRLRRRNRAPLVDVSLFRTPSFVIGTVTALVLFAQAGGLFFVLTLMLQDGLGYSPLAAALVFVPLGLAYVVSTVSVSRIVERAGPRVLTYGYLAGFAGTTAAAVIAYTHRHDLDVWTLVPFLMLGTAANGFGTAPLFATILSDVGPEHAGLAAGTMATATRVGQVLGVVVIGLVFTAALGPIHSAAGDVRAFAIAAAANAVLLLVVTALSLRLAPRARADRLTAVA